MKHLPGTGTLILVGILLPVIISSLSCRNGQKDGNAGKGVISLQDTTYFDTLGIDKALRAGKVAYLNKSRIANNLILVNDGSRNNRVYLMDKNARIWYEWKLGREIAKDAYLMPNGMLLAMMAIDSPQTSYGGQAGMVQLIARDGTVNWEYTHASDDYITHHDAEMLPNGHILTLVRERKSRKEARQAGSQLGIDVYSEAVIEIDPATNEIVWEWHAWDHLVQEVDASKENYGAVAEHPELINLNYVTEYKGDIMHSNGLAYDPERDLIFLTINWFSEVWAIDHSTNTGEAAGHAGGKYRKGGDLVYRFGNPRAYNNDMGKPLLDHVHTPYFVNYGAEPYKNLLVFSNKMDGKEQSVVYEFDLSGEPQLKAHRDNEPKLVWSFTDPDLYSGKVSGAAREANGNTLITEGDYGIWEVTPEKEVVWKFSGKGSFFWRAYPFQKDQQVIKQILGSEH